MADERYEWLDEAAAERLLRGEPDENAANGSPSGAARERSGDGSAPGTGAGASGARPSGTGSSGAGAPGAESSGAESSGAGASGAGSSGTGTSMAGAAELAAALEGLRSGAGFGSAGGEGPGLGADARSGGRELPGEAAALAAFRQSRCAVSARRRSRWGRPVRLGLVTVFAAGALGGVAVAAGTGVLPGPFLFGHAEPEPASSVSVASPDSGDRRMPEPESSESGRPERVPVPDNPAATSPPLPGDGGTADGGTAVTGGTGGGPGGSAESDGGSRGTGTGPDTDAEADGSDPSGGERPDTSRGSGDKGKPAKDWRQRTVKACRDYRANRMPDHVKQYLEVQAKGSDGISRFCDRLLGGGKGDGDGAGSPPDNDEGAQGPGHGNGSGSGGGNGTGGKGGNHGEGDSGGGRGNGSGGGKGNHRTGAKDTYRGPAGSLGPARRTASTPVRQLSPARV
ncbi:hypothetical protein ACIP93_07300 [Streptomyces sp. NPDC088745]|uniref:hypothetical protein n=1 Tax=Streptomyces sp. NPDC088745 TaxID=3365884 RepID=UPI0038232D9D